MKTIKHIISRYFVFLWALLKPVGAWGVFAIAGIVLSGVLLFRLTVGRVIGVMRREFALPHYVMVVGTGERAVRLTFLDSQELAGYGQDMDAIVAALEDAGGAMDFPDLERETGLAGSTLRRRLSGSALGIARKPARTRRYR